MISKENHPPLNIFLCETDSTMREVEQLWSMGIDADVSIRSGFQYLGQGREDHLWSSPWGGLWFSLGIRNLPSYPAMALWIGAIVHQRLCSLFPLLRDQLMIKWTNDIYYGNAKLGGILIKHYPQSGAYNIGIGLNLNNLSISQNEQFRAISLSEILDFEVDLDWLHRFLCLAIYRELSSQTTHHDFISYCNEYLYLKGKKVSVEAWGSKHTGVLKYITETGSVLLEDIDNNLVDISLGTMRELFS